jgi:hypothetical protein
MTQKQPSLHITDLLVTQVWDKNPMTGRSEPGLAVTVTISLTDECGVTTKERYYGLLTPKGACELKPNSEK